LPPGEALALVGVTFVALFALGPSLAGAGAGGVVALELVCVLLPTVAWLWLRGASPALIGLGGAAIGSDSDAGGDLAAARGGGRALAGMAAVAGGLLVGAGVAYVLAAAVEPALERLFPPPPALRHAVERLLLPASGLRPLAIDLVAFALAPAVAEELLFRGALLGALRPRVGTPVAIVASAIAFAAYHGSVYRLAPAALAGLALGGVRVASRSLVSAIAFHVANNAFVVVAVRAGLETPPVTPVAVTTALTALVAGVWLVTGPCRRP
jgi:membrane protease YdiL (CAAX protease family)